MFMMVVGKMIIIIIKITGERGGWVGRQSREGH